MNWLDVALALVVVLSVVSGLASGFVRAAIGFLALVFGLVFALHYYHPLGLYLRAGIPQRGVSNLVGFLIIFCSITIAGAMAAKFLARFVQAADLSWLDRLLGGAFGAVRGVLLATVGIWCLLAFAPVSPSLMIGDSRLAPRMMSTAEKLAAASPDEVQRTFRQSYRELNRVLPEDVKKRLENLPASRI
jgi:membrane protein required for colicin V production